MDLMAEIDLYCERLGPGFWVEPVNAFTNIAFLVAAWVGLAFALRRNLLDWPIGLLAVITLLVGVGSFLAHTVATMWALLSDAIPIQLFILVYFAFGMRRFVGLSWALALTATTAFIVFSALGGQALRALVGDGLNGSEVYVPPLLALIFVGIVLLFVDRRKQGLALLLAALIFTVSLVFRTIDEALCENLPVGTHFLWHIFNGVLLGWLMIALARYGIPKPLGRPEAAR